MGGAHHPLKISFDERLGKADAARAARERRRSAAAVQRQRYKRIPFSSASGSQDSDRHVKTCHVHAVKSAGGRLGSHG